MTSDTFEVHLTLTCDQPNSMNFLDTHAGLEDIWYEFEVDPLGNVTLSANADGFEHLARFFLKMARTGKYPGYHSHQGLEFGSGVSEPELTVAMANRPSASR